MRHPWWPLIENSSACCGNIKEEEPREIEKERSTAICNVAGMTRREQLDVAGCSCRRLRHQNYFATLISLGGVSPPEDSLLSPFLHRMVSLPPPPLSSLSKLLVFSSATMTARRRTLFLHSHRDSFSAPFYDSRKT